MGKNTSSSCLSMVKRAFRSQEAKHNEKRSCRRREKMKSTWAFRWHSNINHVETCELKIKSEAIAAAEPSNYTNVREHFAAIVIQKAFRGCIARRAMRALKGIVKLQALVRGHNVRKRTELARKSKQYSLVQVQGRVLPRQRARLSYEGCRDSMFNESDARCESRYLQDFYSRKSMKWRSRRNLTAEEENEVEERMKWGEENEVEERMKWLDRWMATKQSKSHSRASTDERNSVKEPLQLRLASSRCVKEAHCCYSTANTPNLATVPNYMAATESAKAKARSRSMPKQRPANPERDRGDSLAKKRLPYQANETYVGIGCSSFGHNLKNPSFKGHYGPDQESIYSSCYKESFRGEISPCSTTDVRWLK